MTITEPHVAEGDTTTEVDTSIEADTPLDRTGQLVRDSPMRVRKRNGDLEGVDVNKIVRAVARCSEGLVGVDPMRVATRTISGLVDGATTTELDELSIRTASALVTEEPNYSRLAGRLLATVIDKEVQNHDVHSFSQSVALGHRLGIIADDAAAFVLANARKLNDAIDHRAQPAVRVLRPAHRLRPLPAAPPHRAHGHRDPAVLLHARRRRPVHHGGGGDQLLHADEQARVPHVQPDAVQLRHGAPADQLVLPARLARRTTSTASTTATPTSPGSRSSPAASASPTTASALAGR